MNKALKIGTIFLLLTTMVYSQNFSQIKQAIQSLDQRISTLRAAAEKYHIQKALSVLDRAEGELQQCRTLLQSFQIKAAWKHYKTAKHLVDGVVKTILTKPALKLTAEMEKLINRAERVVQNSDKAEGRYLLTRARSFRNKARQAFRNSQFIRGQEFQRIAIYFANKSIEVTTGQSSSDDQTQRYQQLIHTIQTLYHNISSETENNPGLRALLQKAAAALKAARSNYDKGRMQEALLQIQIAERLLYRAADLKQQSGKGQRERLENNMISLQQYIEGIGQTTGLTNSAANRQLLRKARRFLRAARRDLENNRFQKAELKMNLAQRMATKALRIKENKQLFDETEIQNRIAEVGQLIELQQSKTNADQHEIIVVLHQNASSLLISAKKDLEAGRPSPAMKKVRLALHLVNRVEAILSHKKSTVSNKTQLINRLNQLKQSLESSSQNNRDETITIVIPVLNGLLNRAESALNNNDLSTAWELLDLVQRQLNDVLKSAVH